MIYLYTGTPGSGKSLHLAEAIYKSLRRGQPVIANFEINTQNIKKRKGKKNCPFCTSQIWPCHPAFVWMLQENISPALALVNLNYFCALMKLRFYSIPATGRINGGLNGWSFSHSTGNTATTLSLVGPV